MHKTANAIIRQESWPVVTTQAPPDLVKQYKKALIDADVSSRQAMVAFMHAIARGELKVSQNPNVDRPKRGLAYDKSGVFDDYRVLITDARGKILNPMPFANSFVEKI
jgi:hypothetical protein